jgi:hypothetical protein
MTIRALLLQSLRLFIPSFDPLRRARIRRSARSLITCSPWPPSMTSTAEQVAQLALVRLLYLQKLTRRQARFRQTEAAVLLTRSAVDTCIVGLYCLHVPNALDRLNANNTKSLERLIEPVIDEVVLTTEIINAGILEMPDPLTLPNLGVLVDQIVANGGPMTARVLYERLYRPISTLYTHASGVTLMRHMRHNDRVTERPMAPWTMTGAVNAVDTCVGQLAAAISAPDSADRALFMQYGMEHLKKTPLPVSTMFIKQIVVQFKVKNLPAAIRSARDIRTYLAEAAASDDVETRRNRIREGFQSTGAIIETPMPDVLLESFVDRIMALFDQQSNEASDG